MPVVDGGEAVVRQYAAHSSSLGELVVRTDLDHGKHLAVIHEQSDGTLIARCKRCGESWGVRRKEA